VAAATSGKPPSLQAMEAGFGTRPAEDYTNPLPAFTASAKGQARLHGSACGTPIEEAGVGIQLRRVGRITKASTTAVPTTSTLPLPLSTSATTPHELLATQPRDGAWTCATAPDAGWAFEPTNSAKANANGETCPKASPEGLTADTSAPTLQQTAPITPLGRSHPEGPQRREKDRARESTSDGASADSFHAVAAHATQSPGGSVGSWPRLLTPAPTIPAQAGDFVDLDCVCIQPANRPGVRPWDTAEGDGASGFAAETSAGWPDLTALGRATTGGLREVLQRGSPRDAAGGRQRAPLVEQAAEPPPLQISNSPPLQLPSDAGSGVARSLETGPGTPAQSPQTLQVQHSAWQAAGLPPSTPASIANASRTLSPSFSPTRLDCLNYPRASTTPLGTAEVAAAAAAAAAEAAAAAHCSGSGLTVSHQEEPMEATTLLADHDVSLQAAAAALSPSHAPLLRAALSSRAGSCANEAASAAAAGPCLDLAAVNITDGSNGKLDARGLAGGGGASATAEVEVAPECEAAAHVHLHRGIMGGGASSPNGTAAHLPLGGSRYQVPRLRSRSTSATAAGSSP
jgi:hypothetical protein